MKRLNLLNKWFINVQKDILYNIVVEKWEREDFELAFSRMPKKYQDHHEVLMQIYEDTINKLEGTANGN